MKHTNRISRRRLEELGQQLSERDKGILRSLHKCRYLTTRQITQLHFQNSTTPKASFRAANRGLVKLRDLGLIGALKRRIGGVRAGSGSYVWALKPVGFRLLNLNNMDSPQRKQFCEPAACFLEHTLLVAEAYTQLTKICERRGMSLAKAALEPECWRRYQDNGGKMLTLKPDLFAVTHANGYEDCWFIELDRATETPRRIVDKCDRYLQYLRSGVEQKQTGIFPYIVWIVPDEKRKDSVRHHISEAFPHGPDIFITIVPDELETLVVDGAAKFLKAQGGCHVKA